MDTLISDVSMLDFITEYQLDKQIGLGVLPFSTMNKSGSGVCKNFYADGCNLGNYCPFRHIKADKKIVCKHWLRGLCKKGDECEFLHEYDMSRMPECYFFTRFGVCMNKECNFLHIDPASKIQDCPWYERGFCRNGPICKNRHVRRKMCINYINGFCPKGKDCELSHPKFWPLPISAFNPNTDENVSQTKKVFTCNFCGEKGHKIQYCHKLSQEDRLKVIQSFTKTEEAEIPTRNIGPIFLNQYDISKHLNKAYQQASNQNGENGENQSNQPRNLEEVTCYKCGEKGHYANKCNKGYLAFLSRNNQQQLLAAQVK